jgi:hypothetical protein
MTHTANDHSSGTDGHREDFEPQGATTKHALENGPYSRDTNHSEFRMPKTNFPMFDATHSKMWKEQAEKYFHMFQVHEEYKIDYATLHFKGNAAFWYRHMRHTMI